MKGLKAATLAAVATVCLAAPSFASAADEEATATINMEPQGTLFKDAKRPVNWAIETLISTAANNIYPLKVATINNPTQLAFFPDSSMPNCPDSAIGPPPVNVSIPVSEAVSRCPDSIIGNGDALFQLGGINTPAQNRFAYMVIYKGDPNSSLVPASLKGRPRLKIYAYSYGTNAGIYTEASLSTTGQLVFNVPRLTADSAVTSLNLNIPGEEIAITDPAAPPAQVVPAGDTPTYARANCPGTEWSLSGSFLLGNRNNAGQSVPPESTVTASDTQPCTGVAGTASLSSVKVSGPSTVKAGKVGTFKVTIANGGTANATGARLAVSGRGVSFSTSAGTIPAEGSRTVTVRAKFKKKGKVRATFKATSSGGSKSASKTVTVK